jgi:4-nitrophenyl phosphatase
MEAFKNIRGLIIDMDGVLWHGTKPIPGLTEFFQILRSKQIRFILATNNASLTPEQYVAKLAGMGVAVELNEIMTSALATALYLSQQTDPTKTRVFVVGEDGAKQALINKGFTLTDLYEYNDGNPDHPQNGADYVVVGKDETLSWQKLATATLNIRAGAKFIGTNADTTLPTERGLTHGNGAILAALQAATDVVPVSIGKPEPIMYQQAIGLLDLPPDDILAIGDKMSTDILGAVRTSIRSILVLTGVSNREELKTTDYQPTWVMEDIREITAAIQNKL